MKLLITEKPSVAMEFAKALKINMNRKDGYIESDGWIITWCVGHLVTMSYPEVYDEKLKFWRLDTLPFIPTEWKYEIIPNVQKQFNIVQRLLQREDVEEIYNAGDSGREGEYIQRLVYMMAKPNPKAQIKRVWIDSQTEEEIKRGIREAKNQSEYDSLADSAYLRAKEDYLIGINFSRLLTIIYGRRVASKINEEKRVNEITKEERRNLVKVLKKFELTIKDFRPVEEAIITSGGINIKEINPKTMESKLVKGLYFAGEIMDVDSYTGGFNLQIAYSTGYTAGMHVGDLEE